MHTAAQKVIKMTYLQSATSWSSRPIISCAISGVGKFAFSPTWTFSMLASSLSAMCSRKFSVSRRKLQHNKMAYSNMTYGQWLTAARKQTVTLKCDLRKWIIVSAVDGCINRYQTVTLKIDQWTVAMASAADDCSFKRSGCHSQMCPVLRRVC